MGRNRSRGGARRAVWVCTLALLTAQCEGNTLDTENLAPVGSLVGPDTADVGAPVTYTCSATDPDGGVTMVTGWFPEPASRSADGRNADLRWDTPGDQRATCTFVDDEGEDGAVSKRVVVTPATLPTVTDIQPLDNLVRGRSAPYLVVSTARGSIEVTATGARVDRVNADTIFATPTSLSHALTVTLDVGGRRSGGYTKAFIALAEPSFVAVELAFAYGALDDGRLLEGTVVLPNGKRIPIEDGVATITANDSIEPGVRPIEVEGRLQRQHRWVDFVDGGSYALEVIGPDIRRYEKIVSLMWSGGSFQACDVASGEDCLTRRWERAPTLILVDNGYLAYVGDQPTLVQGADVPGNLTLESDDVADISFFAETVMPAATGFPAGSVVLTSTLSESELLFFEEPFSRWPSGAIYAAVSPQTRTDIDHIEERDGHALLRVLKQQSANVGISRLYWVVQLLEALGYNTGSASVAAFLYVPEGAPAQLLFEAGRVFYSPQRPAGSGRAHGYQDWLNNRNVPDSPLDTPLG